MDTGNLDFDAPRWWQRLIPRYGNWGGVGWSAGRWNNDPDKTDWSCPAKDRMDELFKAHDWAYQHGGDLDAADAELVRGLRDISPESFHGSLYRLLAMGAFTVWPPIRRLWRRVPMRKVLCVLALFLALCVAGHSAQPGGFRFAIDEVVVTAAPEAVPGITPQDFPASPVVVLQAPAQSPEAHWIWSLLGGSTVAAILAAVGRMVQNILSGIKDARAARACQFVYAATMASYHEYVRVVKDKSADGKLTIDEKNEALQYAYRKAIDLAKTQGFDILKVFAKETILALIERYVGESKAPRAVKAVAGPLADLAPSRPSV